MSPFSCDDEMIRNNYSRYYISSGRAVTREMCFTFKQYVCLGPIWVQCWDNDCNVEKIAKPTLCQLLVLKGLGFDKAQEHMFLKASLL